MAGDTKNDDKMPIGMNFEKDAPCAHSATKCSVDSFEKLDVAAVWVGAHVFEGGVDVLHVDTRHVAKIARSGLVITKAHVMPLLIERYEFQSPVSASAFGYNGTFFGCGEVGKLADEFYSCHILLNFGQFPHLIDRLLQQLAHKP